MALAIIYDGFVMGSELVTVRAPGITPGDTVRLYDEDTHDLLGSQVATADDVEIVTSPLNSRRIIAFAGVFGMGTAGGVDVLETDKVYTGWETPEPVDEEAVPEDIGLYNPGAETPLTARYNRDLKNSVPVMYKAAAILLASEPILFDVKITYRVDEPTGDKIAIVQVTSIRNTRGIFSVTIDSTPGSSKTFNVDKTFNIVVTDAEGRTATRSETVNPVTGYMPVAPTPPASTIEMYLLNSYLAGGGYLVTAEARSANQLEISYDAGANYQNMIKTGTRQGSNKDGFLSGTCDVVIRVVGTPGDFIAKTIPVPYP